MEMHSGNYIVEIVARGSCKVEMHNGNCIVEIAK
jgi:hypothetical protein